MKTIFTLMIASILLSINVIAQNTGRLIIKNSSSSNPDFIVSLNGIRLNNTYAQQVTFNFLDEQNYRLKILQAGSANVLSYNVNSQPGYLSVYVLNQDPYGNYSIILESKSINNSVPEPVVTTPSVAPTATVPPVPTNTVPSNPRFPKAIKYELPTTTPTVTTNTTTTVETPTVVVINAISQEDFDDRLKAIKNTSFDKDKLAKAKMVLRDEYYTTNQVIEVVKLFSFDNFKLDFAKWAYKNTMDKKNYYKVQDHLSFSSSKNDLGNFIMKQPKDN